MRPCEGSSESQGGPRPEGANTVESGAIVELLKAVGITLKLFCDGFRDVAIVSDAAEMLGKLLRLN